MSPAGITSAPEVGTKPHLYSQPQKNLFALKPSKSNRPRPRRKHQATCSKSFSPEPRMDCVDEVSFSLYADIARQCPCG
jgi:hypothetical protein